MDKFIGLNELRDSYKSIQKRLIGSDCFSIFIMVQFCFNGILNSLFLGFLGKY